MLHSMVKTVYNNKILPKSPFPCRFIIVTCLCVVFGFLGLGWLGVVLFTACVNLMYVGRPAVMVSAILAARHRTFVLVVTSLFVCFFPMHNKFLLLLLLLLLPQSLLLSSGEICGTHGCAMKLAIAFYDIRLYWSKCVAIYANMSYIYSYFLSSVVDCL